MKRAQLWIGITSLIMGVCLLTPRAQAGPFILAGTDADDHGFASSGVNQSGWFVMQRVLENLAASPELTNGFKTVVALGTSSGTALTAFNSAFNLSTRPGAG